MARLLLPFEAVIPPFPKDASLFDSLTSGRERRAGVIEAGSLCLSSIHRHHVGALSQTLPFPPTQYSALQSQLAAVKTRYEERIQELERHNCEPPSPAGSAEEVRVSSLRLEFLMYRETS